MKDVSTDKSSAALMQKAYSEDILEAMGFPHCHTGYWEDSQMSFAEAQAFYLEKFFAPLTIDENSNILDIGGGSGGTAIWLAEKYKCRITVVDIVPEMISSAQNKINDLALENHIHTICGDILELDFSIPFSHIISVEAIHHILDKKQLFSKLYDWLAPQGEIKISTFAFNLPLTFVRSAYLDISLAEGNIVNSFQEYQELISEPPFQEASILDVTQQTLVPTSLVFYDEPYLSQVKEFLAQTGSSFLARLWPSVSFLYKKYHFRMIAKQHIQAIWISMQK